MSGVRALRDPKETGLPSGPVAWVPLLSLCYFVVTHGHVRCRKGKGTEGMKERGLPSLPAGAPLLSPRPPRLTLLNLFLDFSSGHDILCHILLNI